MHGQNHIKLVICFQDNMQSGDKACIITGTWFGATELDQLYTRIRKFPHSP